MKTSIKKIFGLLMTLAIFVSSVGVSQVFAAGSGSIKVTGATAGKSYGIYKVFDLTYTGNNVAYTIAPEWVDFFKTGSGQTYISDTNTDGTLNPITVDGEAKFINITNANVAEFAMVAMGEIKNKTRADVQDAAGDTVMFTGLDLGYYLVHPEGASETENGQTSIVSLTSTTPNGEVVVKGKYPTIVKEAESKSADYGGTIKFTVKGKVPDTTGYNKYEYVLKDTLPTGLTYTQGSITVTIAGNDSKSLVTTLIDGQNITVSFDILNLIANNKAKAGDEIVVTYETTVNKDFTLGNTGEANKAIVEFSNDPKDGESKDKTPEVKVKVYSGKIKVIKHKAGDEGTKLQGAEFVLYKKVSGVEKYYKLTEEAGKKTVSWVDSIDNATVMTSDANGELAFDGIAAGTYFLKETKAPEGYNLLTEDKEITLSDDELQLKMEAEPKIENRTGLELPGTGGAGTGLFALIGGVIILYSALSLIKRKLRPEVR